MIVWEWDNRKIIWMDLHLFEDRLGSEFSAYETKCLGGLPLSPLPMDLLKIDVSYFLFMPNLFNLLYLFLRSN